MMGREDYVELIEDRYFGNMAQGRPGASVALFAPDAVLTARFSGLPARVARHRPGEGEETLTAFFSVVLETFRVGYRDFWHAIDVPGQRVCSLYTLRLDARHPEAGAGDGPVRELRNVNFFQFDHGRIREVLVSGVAVGAAVGLG
jgi:hypothetical protein